MSEAEVREDTPGASVQDAAFLEDLHRQMLKFATLQLGDAHLAEDAVQDALMGALKNVSSFRGRAALKTWVFAILKNKIADTLRQRRRMVSAEGLLGADDDDSDASSPFNRWGYWYPSARPREWSSPEAALHDSDFWRIFTTCLEGLPPRQARVFMMREFIELESAEICASVGISISNLHVILHRARLRLRGCLESHWITVRDEPC
jgi:RNA polymerase sigma-70 factor (TIGR02943 family)